MTPSLAGKRALVTGASSGLGLHLARLLAQHGAQVVMAARRVDALREIAAIVTGPAGAARAMALDVTDARSRCELAASVGPPAHPRAQRGRGA